MYLIVDAMTKVFAPILAFTCDEIWQKMPHREGEDSRNVLLNRMPEGFEAYLLDRQPMEKWETVMKLRQDVNGVLELARAEKRIGKALEAHVRLAGSQQLQGAVQGVDLAEIFLVSSCSWERTQDAPTQGSGTNFPELSVGVSEARGQKCPRCWMHSENANEEGLCPRCQRGLSKLDIQLD